MKRPATLILTLCLTMIVAQAYAQSSLGIGANEVAMKPTGPFAHIILWMNEQQRAFYLAMTNALKAMRDDPWQASVLVGLSFIYGIFHAAGPGHGKAVISSYMIANETALRRGIFLSFISSLLQAIMAIAVVGLAWFLLRGTGISMNQTARYMEIASFALVLFFGLWLLARKLPLLFKTQDKANPSPASSLFAAAPEPVTASGPAWQGSISQATRAAATGSTVKLNYKPTAATAPDHVFIGQADVCAACGNAHIANPSTLGDDFNWKTAWSAILSVGLRPCSGALIVLTFALLNGLMVGGILSVFAMAFGTFITVAVLATLAVTAKNTALRFAGSNAMSGRLKAAIEVAAALFIALTGALLLSASLVS
ncbi:nickel/cobalt transporter [Ochrobactrum sp. CGA5]|uniref:nickel/cobalt transporter n=1 Tax=Ochrobactrum sp. CGA5 TaxID=2583453 RepID=UPI0011221480|nr:nickel/cobalt transporter [Ochrobactrum sp. CGA5]